MEDAKVRWKDELARLTVLDAVSGHEGPVVRYLQEAFAPLADEVTVDAMGNLYAVREGGNAGELMVGAHSDEIGALVSAIDPDGFIRFTAVGGLTEVGFAGRKVRVAGHPGVVGLRPGHLIPESERRTLPPLATMYIDLGVESREEVEALGIRIGDGIVAQSELTPLANPHRVAGKAIDNRIGCLVLLELLRRLQGQDLPGRLTAVVAVQEEVGLKGARAAARRVEPDVALVVDTVPCADTPDSHGVHTFPVRLGGGPVIQTSSGRAASGYLMPETIRAYLTATAEGAGIPYQLATFAFGNTDASAIYAEGVPTGVATLPRRYSHSPIEMLDLNDVAATLDLCEAVVRSVGDFPRGIL